MTASLTADLSPRGFFRREVLIIFQLVKIKSGIIRCLSVTVVLHELKLKEDVAVAGPSSQSRKASYHEPVFPS
jgi:hypothetical protein